VRRIGFIAVAGVIVLIVVVAWIARRPRSSSPGNTAEMSHSARRAPRSAFAEPSSPPSVLSRFTANTGRAAAAALDRGPDAESEAFRAVETLGRAEEIYGALFQRLGVDDVTRGRLRQILAERQMVSQDIARTFRDATAEIPEAHRRVMIGELLANNQRDFDGRLRGELGDAGLLALKAYDATLPQRAAATALQQRLKYTPTPLTDTQLEEVVPLLAASAGERTPMIFHLGQMMAGFTAESVERVSEALEPRQREVLRSMWAEQRARSARNRRPVEENAVDQVPKSP
jgi:hypothetical protein